MNNSVLWLLVFGFLVSGSWVPDLKVPVLGPWMPGSRVKGSQVLNLDNVIVSNVICRVNEKLKTGVWNFSCFFNMRTLKFEL